MSNIHSVSTVNIQNTDIKYFLRESDFEQALTELLLRNGWNEVIMNPTEEDLIANWAKIIYDMNNEIDKLDGHPLTSTEMQQIITKVNMCKTPYDVSNFINGNKVCITRDNPKDTRHLGKEIYLKIFDAKEIQSGKSRYQIARQPRFKTSSQITGDRRGDMLLLINGMPVIHIELKRSKVDVSQATYQLKRYAHEGVFDNGIFKMVQIFVAMTPEETLYFANPGAEDKFAPQFYFHWATDKNVIIRDWQRIAIEFLSIPIAHQMIGYYTIADDKDKTLKVLRSYQYWAVNKISDVVHQTNWDDHQHKGGYIWHTTGSGKTMTSFKSAQLIASSGDADKVVFLLDRIELSVQSLDEYRGFAGETDSVQDTADTSVLFNKLMSNDKEDTLIVTSLQKMHMLCKGGSTYTDHLKKIGQKRLVFIIDECHRGTSGKSLMDIKRALPRALLFGFTGTPVFDVNAKNEITTTTLFGNQLHQYTIANGILDKNVLGFDIWRGETYQEEQLRELAAFHEISQKLRERPDYDGHEITSLDEIEDDEELMKIYDRFINVLKMPTSYTENGVQERGVEAYLPKDLYKREEHYRRVAENIISGRPLLSKNGKFHAMLATKSIPEAIAYYKLFKENYSSYNVVAVFDNNIDNTDDGIAREDAIVEMLTDYNTKYGTSFVLASYAQYKKDVAKRLAHKKPYIGIEHDHSKQIDILIVVTQMLTGYDSKWVNTLYVDKTMKFVDIIQAFSRTNRLFGPDKPFGIIKYYTLPFTMEQNINDAMELYMDNIEGVFVDKLETNLHHINSLFNHIRNIFTARGINNFERLPDAREDRNMFAKDFSKMSHLLEAVKLQGFVWEQDTYEFKHEQAYARVRVELDEHTYLVLLQRYRELFVSTPGPSQEPWEYEIDTYITETGVGTIDAEYINSKFVRFVQRLYNDGPLSELTKNALQDLHRSFASLSQKDQRTAMVIINDIKCGVLRLSVGKTIYDYIAEYQVKELKEQVLTIADATGLNASQLINIMNNEPNEGNINEFNRFESLKQTLDKDKTKVFLSKVYNTAIAVPMVMIKADQLLRKFILEPDSRAKIISAYVTDGVSIDTVISIEEQPIENIDDIATGETSEQQKLREESNKLSVDEMIENVWQLVRKDLRRIENMPDTKEVVKSFFKILTIDTIPSVDGVGIDVYKAMDELFRRRTVNWNDKFVDSGTLSIKFEVFLKKIYYMLHGCEIESQKPGVHATLANCIFAFPCLERLKWSSKETERKLSSYLDNLRNNRNAQGNGAHFSYLLSDKEVDENIKSFVTLYLYVVGMSLNELKTNYSI